MRFAIWLALAKGVILESIRRKDLWVVAILGFLILVTARALSFFGVQDLEVFIKDLAVTVLGLFSTIMAVLISTRILPEEIKNKTLYPLLARPVSRLDLLLGKLLGAILVSWISFGLLALMTSIALLSFGVSFEAVMLQYVLLKMMGLALICSVGVAISTFMTPSGAATMTLILAFASSMISRALFMAGAGQPSMAWLYNLLTAIFPQPHLFDIGRRVVYKGWAPVPAWVIGDLSLYLVLYGAAMVAVGWLKFRRQAL